jgi:secretion/DNA translocation related TadE-like protein
VSLFAVAVLAVGLASAVGALGTAVRARHQAAGAADLAALAAAGQDPPSCRIAADVARWNRAALRSCTVALDGSVTVLVAVQVGLGGVIGPALGPALPPAVGRARAGPAP